jgi:NAD(P)-dependent dehydrogenase (short-subunit alcohol dehydrogenase family)
MRTRRAMQAIPRAGQPEEIAEAAAYPASDAAAFMTGQCLTLDREYTVR